MPSFLRHVTKCGVWVGDRPYSMAQKRTLFEISLAPLTSFFWWLKEKFEFLLLHQKLSFFWFKIRLLSCGVNCSRNSLGGKCYAWQEWASISTSFLLDEPVYCCLLDRNVRADERVCVPDAFWPQNQTMDLFISAQMQPPHLSLQPKSNPKLCDVGEGAGPSASGGEWACCFPFHLAVLWHLFLWAKRKIAPYWALMTFAVYLMLLCLLKINLRWCVRKMHTEKPRSM